MVVYNFGQVQCTSQVERKTKCFKKSTGYSRPLDCLVSFLFLLILALCSMITVSSLNQKPTGTKLYLDSSKDLIKCVVLKVKSSFRKLKTIKYHLENLKL